MFHGWCAEAAAGASSLAPQWDLSLVLRALIKAPFEPFLVGPTEVFIQQNSSAFVSDVC